jgi:hypothetical protein
VGRGHADVDHHQLGGLLSNQRQQLGGVAGLAGDLEAGAFQQAGQPLTEQDIILGQDHPQPGRRHRPGLWSSTGDTYHAAGEEPQMLDHYFAALFSLGQTRGLAHSAQPDAR